MQERYEVGDRIENLEIEVADVDGEWEGGWSVRDREVDRVVAVTPIFGDASRIAHALNVLGKLEQTGIVRMNLARDVPR